MAGIAAIAHLTMNTTMEPKGILMSVILTGADDSEGLLIEAISLCV